MPPGSKSAVVRPAPIVVRNDVSWIVLIVGGIVLVFGLAVLIGAALSALPFVVGAFVAFAVVALLIALVVFRLPGLWARLPR